MRSNRLNRMIVRGVGGLAFAVIATGSRVAPAATTITQWNFNSTVVAPDNSPSPTTGAGTAIVLGMTNNYTYANSVTGSQANADILSSPSVANGAFSEFTWRIRGANPGNGWNLAAPQYSQGAEFDASTAGFQNIVATFDWFSTNQGVRTLQEQYTIDGTNWVIINPVLQAVPNDYNQSSTINGAGTTMTPNTIDLSGISGAANNPSFGIRLVSAYDPTYGGAGAPTYTSATVANGQYNNSSGNWRFADISISGTAIPAPEPTSGAILAGCAVGLMARRRRV